MLLTFVAQEAALITAIILLAKQSAKWRTLVKGAEADLQKLLDIQDATNKPLPTSTKGIRRLMDG